jgi:hypothetical protein
MIGQAQAHVLILAGALKDSYPDTRAAASETLRELGEKARAAVSQMLETIQDPKGETFSRIHCAQALGGLKDDADKSAPVLVAVMSDSKAPLKVRNAAGEAIARLGSAAADIVSDLAKLLDQPKDKKSPELHPAEIRRAAALGLVKMGEKAKSAWPAAKKALEQDGDPGVRLQLARFAGHIGREENQVVPALEKVCKDDPVTENRLAAIQELGELGRVASGAVSTLQRLADEDIRLTIREAAQAALRKIKGE